MARGAHVRQGAMVLPCALFVVASALLVSIWNDREDET
jgi:hypothetical protein